MQQITVVCVLIEDSSNVHNISLACKFSWLECCANKVLIPYRPKFCKKRNYSIEKLIYWLYIEECILSQMVRYSWHPKKLTILLYNFSFIVFLYQIQIGNYIRQKIMLAEHCFELQTCGLWAKHVTFSHISLLNNKNVLKLLQRDN